MNYLGAFKLKNVIVRLLRSWLSQVNEVCLVRANGAKYVGEWKDDKMHGQGTYTYAKSGNKYVSEYRNNKMHGQGTFTYANGKVVWGTFENDKYVGGPTIPETGEE